jgi:tetratricopeptide (TPR) repeat protein
MLTPFIKKDPLTAALILLAVLCVLWFWLAPGNFKAVWSKNPVVVDMVKEHDLAEQKSKIMAISYYYPYFPYYAGIVAGREQPKKEWMEGYYLGRPYIFQDYYRMASDLFPEIDAPHFLLGYCDYYMGDLDTARAQFEKTVDLNPYFFWSYYDLGVIYFQQRDYYKSAVILNKALSLRKEYTLEILHQSAFYMQIWRYLSDPKQALANNLGEGQNDGMLLLAACFVKAAGYDQALQIIQSAGSNPWHQQLWALLRKAAVSRQKTTDDFDRLIQEQIPVRLF